MSYNKVIIIGNLVRDPELRFTPKGTAICKVTLGLNRTWTGDDGVKHEEATFVDCDAFGRTAENLAQYKRKGHEVLVEGRLKLDQWDDKQTGQKRSKLTVVVESVSFLRVPATADRGGEAPAADTARGQASAEDPQPDARQQEDDVPF